MKESYTGAEIEVIRFQSEDILTASDPVIDPKTGLPIL